MKGIPFVAVLGVALVSAAGGSASAREFAVNGSIHYKVEPTGQVNLAAGRTLVSQRLVGTIKVDDESAPINDSSQECVGAFVIQDGQTLRVTAIAWPTMPAVTPGGYPTPPAPPRAHGWSPAAPESMPA